MKRDNQEFLAYKEQLEQFPYYTKLTDEDTDRWVSHTLPPEKFTFKGAREHPAKWLYWICGVKPRKYQVRMLDDMMKSDAIAGVTSRQIGKSVMTAGFAFWAAYNNMYPAGMEKKTTIVVISHTEDASKKLLQEVLSFVKMADTQMAIYTKNKPNQLRSYFSDRMTEKPTQYKLEWAQGKILVLPPTDKVRGNSASVLIIDEADFLRNDDPDYFFNSVALPTTTATKGKVILWSTPRGTESYFKRIIQPDLDRPLDGWKRVWFPWTIVEEDSVIDTVWNKRSQYIQKGDENDFKIEYEASFLSGKHTFFNPEIIDKCVFDYMAPQDFYDNPVTIGIDFGDTFSRTVVAVVRHEEKQNVTSLLNIKEFPSGFNNADIVPYIDRLKERYTIGKIVVDDCVGGATAISLLETAGYKLERFVFRKSKLEYYEYMKNAFANNRIKMYNEHGLIAQLKSLESHETHMGNTQIKKPTSGRDDKADAFMLACSPHITPKSGFRRVIL
jgi:hypothetical protein